MCGKMELMLHLVCHHLLEVSSWQWLMQNFASMKFFFHKIFSTKQFPDLCIYSNKGWKSSENVIMKKTAKIYPKNNNVQNLAIPKIRKKCLNALTSTLGNNSQIIFLKYSEILGNKLNNCAYMKINTFLHWIRGCERDSCGSCDISLRILGNSQTG